MPGPYPYNMKGVDDFVDPVSFRYEMRTPWGLMAQDLSVDIRIFINDPSYYPKIGEALWRSTIATAISVDVSLDLFWWVRWRSGALATPAAPSFGSRGRQYGTPAGRAHTAIVQMDTGHGDNAALRCIHLPSTPLVWQSGGMLTDRGWDSLMCWAQGLRMGLAGEDLGGDLQHIIAFPRIIPPTLENLAGVLFRKVGWLRVLQYTDKAPDFPGGLWP
jgi:hypothetical protein